jgi:surface polysaccharide O-acyltransferase-like enzyme
MSVTVRPSADWTAIADSHAPAAASRDEVIDTLRGIAILMVIGIHSLQQPLDAPWAIAVDAALRPCVPVFLFASGYLTMLSGRVPLTRRITATLIPYAIAFAAAYVYMTLHNQAMDHRAVTALARFVLAYVFVYYYVFVYVGCTVVMWLILAIVGAAPDSKQRLGAALVLAIAAGLVIGSYIDPALARFGVADSLIEEVRLRDIPFWFSFMAAGALAAMGGNLVQSNLRSLLLTATLFAYTIYAAARIYSIGDAAAYDSIAFFAYAALLCCWLLAARPKSAMLAAIGSGSYFIYLWHIFIVMALRDHAALRQLGPFLNAMVTSGLTALLSVAALVAVRQVASPRLLRWLGA